MKVERGKNKAAQGEETFHTYTAEQVGTYKIQIEQGIGA